MHYIALNTISLLRYFFHIAYQGTAYNGWQKQPLKLSVQAVLENTLSKILKTNITVIGCGRTDAGVHASQYYFHIDVVVAIDC